jgi:hypothetical protein
MAGNGRNSWEEKACVRKPPRISHEKLSKNGSLTAKKRNEKWRFQNEKQAKPK